MKKNKMMRMASALLVATLLSTSVIAGTFAKYTTSAEGTDTARVAKWGVTVTATADQAFAEKYNDSAEENGVKVVSSETGKKVVAPGTKGTLLTYSISGQPEVMVNVTATANLTLTGWTIGTNETYCPIVFKVKRGSDGAETTYKLGSATDETDHVYATTTELKTAIEKTITDMSKTSTAANTSLADSITISWEWPFADANTDAYQTDEKDTALGDLGTAPTIKMESSITVDQVD